MWRRCLIIGTVFALGMILLTASAWAFDDVDEKFVPCEQEELVGTWDVYVWSMHDDCLREQCWDRCELTIGSGGTVGEKSTYFSHPETVRSLSRQGVLKAKYISKDSLGGSWMITGGQLTMDSGCVIRGKIYTSIGTLYIDHGGIVEDQLVLRAVLRNLKDLGPVEPEK